MGDTPAALPTTQKVYLNTSESAETIQFCSIIFIGIRKIDTRSKVSQE